MDFNQVMGFVNKKMLNLDHGGLYLLVDEMLQFLREHTGTVVVNAGGFPMGYELIDAGGETLDVPRVH